MKIDGKCDSAIELDVKRFYVDGFVLSGDCPQCNEPYRRNFGDDYFSYPTANVAFDFDAYCECGHEWKVPIVIRLSVELA